MILFASRIELIISQIQSFVWWETFDRSTELDPTQLFSHVKLLILYRQRRWPTKLFNGFFGCKSCDFILPVLTFECIWTKGRLTKTRLSLQIITPVHHSTNQALSDKKKNWVSFFCSNHIELEKLRTDSCLTSQSAA